MLNPLTGLVFLLHIYDWSWLVDVKHKTIFPINSIYYLCHLSNDWTHVHSILSFVYLAAVLNLYKKNMCQDTSQEATTACTTLCSYHRCHCQYQHNYWPSHSLLGHCSCCFWFWWTADFCEMNIQQLSLRKRPFTFLLAWANFSSTITTLHIFNVTKSLIHLYILAKALVTDQEAKILKQLALPVWGRAGGCGFQKWSVRINLPEH